MPYTYLLSFQGDKITRYPGVVFSPTNKTCLLLRVNCSFSTAFAANWSNESVLRGKQLICQVPSWPVYFCHSLVMTFCWPKFLWPIITFFFSRTSINFFVFLEPPYWQGFVLCLLQILCGRSLLFVRQQDTVWIWLWRKGCICKHALQLQCTFSDQTPGKQPKWRHI